MATLGVLMDSLACEAGEGGYIREEARDKRDVKEVDLLRPFRALYSDFDAAERFYLILSFTRNQSVSFASFSTEIEAR